MKYQPLPENFLKRMSKADRLKMGKAGVTAEEAAEKFTARSERELQNQIAGWLRINGYAFHQSRMDRKTTGTLGWPDFTLAVNGQGVAIEVKMPGKQPTAEQLACHAAMRKNGWIVMIADSLKSAVWGVGIVEGAE